MTWRVFFTLMKLAVAIRSSHSRLSHARSVAYAVLGIVTFIPMMLLLYRLFHALYFVLSLVGAGSLTFGLTVVYAQVLSLLFGVIYVITRIYYSEDIETLLPYPLARWLLPTSRFVAMYLVQLGSLAFFVLPAFLAYALPQHSALVYATVVLTFVLLPVAPLTVAFLMVSFVMRAANLRPLRGAAQWIGVVVFLLVYVGIRLAGHSKLASVMHNGVALRSLLAGPNGYLTLATQWFPPSLWLIKGVTGHGTAAVTAWVWTTATLTVCVAAIVLLGPRLFLNAYVGASEQGSRRGGQPLSTRPRPGFPRSVAASAQSAPPVRTLPSQFGTFWRKEFTTFFRSPTYVLNGFSFLLVSVIAVAGPFIGGHDGVPRRISGDHLYNTSLVGWIGALFIFLLGSSNLVAVSSISREGPQFVHLKTLPIRPVRYVLAKWNFANLFSAFSTVVVLSAEVAIFRATLPALLLSGCAGACACLGYNAACLIVDLHLPRLDWTSEQMAIRGLKSGLTLLGAYVFAAVLFALALALRNLVHAPWLALDTVLALVIMGCTAVAVSFLLKGSERWLAAIE